MDFRISRFATLAVAASVALGGASVHAGETYSAAQREALGAVDALFVAMARHDVEASRRLILPGANFVVLLPDGKLRIEADTGYLDTLSKRKEAFLERIWDAQVTVQGNLAQVWAPYDFHLDGKLSHCGIDSFSLARTADGWRIAGISYTVQKVGCAPSPLGAVHPQ
ncbi:nuclear transport factor 2 family protein [Rhodanobacter sp. FDAARGOS 1247]|uniref:nuclear transport factor 2 family protein n=1 Tax=Rhodanobacter sp. FDAARGOS 1247 TaxID=2778082 RepID=UPI0019521304|nr:nuclear transport factor 2 family protein [Rhodanobacter sp. FDAARGOS 1247]QRP62556.1 nuclear transport factor 2 family protein [Rhodanobacter sp. FDAARGOS 1247]